MSNRVVIVGGGFGGIYTAKELLKKGFDVLLINEKNYFTFTPLLHEIATGNLTSSDIIFEYERFFNSKRFSFTRGRVTSVDFDAQTVSMDDVSESYDYLVLATGSTTNYFSLEGRESCMPLKTVEDAHAIKRRLIELAQGPQKCVDVCVVGGGPTGVELILEMEQFLRAFKKNEPRLRYSLRLVHARDEVLHMFDERVRAYALKVLRAHDIEVVLNAKASSVTLSQVETTSGTYDANIAIMAGGVAPNTQWAPTELLDERKQIVVNKALQVNEHKNVFALGDIISQEGQMIPKLAQTATQEACVVATNIDRLHKNQTDLEAYTPDLKGTLVSLGHGHGAGTVFGITLKGFFAWWLWRTVYLFKTPGLVNKLRIAFSWTLALFSGKNLTEE